MIQGPKLFVLVTISFLIVQLFGQTPPTWGGNPRYTVNVKMLNDDPVATWMFKYYYDWNLKVERYEHQAPEQD